MNEKDFDTIINSLRELSNFIYNLAQDEKQKKALRNERLFSFNSGRKSLFPAPTADELAIQRRRDRYLKELFADSKGLLPEQLPTDAGHKVDSQLNNVCNNTSGNLPKKKEISKMLMDITGVSINSTPRKDGRYQGYYMSNGKKCYVYGKTFEHVEKKLKSLLKQGLIDLNNERGLKTNTPTTFNAFATYYFEMFRKKKVAENTFKGDISRYKGHLLPYFKEKPLKKITPGECQELLDKLNAAGKHKTAEELHSLLQSIFKAAIAHSVLDKNPLDIVIKEVHEREHGKALSSEEIALLKERARGTYCEQSFMIYLYAGLRPNEIESVHIENGFIISINSKRKGKNKPPKYKRIPISVALAPYLNGELKLATPDHARRMFKFILPNHKLYDLRTTFNTRCEEAKIDDKARKFFMGHSLGKLDDAYTDFSDQFLIEELKKVSY